MKYRPNHVLADLRHFLDIDESKNRQRDSAQQQQPPPPFLRLRWLRTVVMDCTDIVTKQRDNFVQHIIRQQQRSVAAIAVEQLILHEIPVTSLSMLERFVAADSLPRLTSLDLRGCSENLLGTERTFLDGVNPFLKRLYLPVGSSVNPRTLERFTQLEELDMCECDTISSIHFCSGTLRVLYADSCDSLNDAGLASATLLEVLHINNSWKVHTVAPFAHKLLDLDISLCHHVSDLSGCHRLRVLRAANHSTIRSLQPFADELRELNAGGETCVLDDVALAEATSLVKLEVMSSTRITTVAPFSNTLIYLNAKASSLDDAGIASAVHLTYLDASQNTFIRSIAPFADTIVELDIHSRSGIDSNALSLASSLVRLEVSWNAAITKLPLRSANSLKHLCAMGKDCGLTNESLAESETQLVTLDCSYNPAITVIDPKIAQCLDELMAEGSICGLTGSTIVEMKKLRMVYAYENPSILPEHVRSFRKLLAGRWIRNQL